MRAVMAGSVSPFRQARPVRVSSDPVIDGVVPRRGRIPYVMAGLGGYSAGGGLEGAPLLL
jgi:hypothetical protein